MTEIVCAVAGKVSKYLVAPIGRHLRYLFCYRSHTDDLRNNVETLGTARDDLQITVEEARRRGDEIRPIVINWLDRVDQITGEAEELMKDIENKRCFSGWCPNLKSRYQIGREAYKKAQVIVEIQTDRNFPDGVSYHVPSRSVTFKEYEAYESRAPTLNKIMDALRDESKTKKIIGVWGMGGVGKTTLVKQVAEQARQQNLFTTQVYVDVSWTREDAKFEGISSIQQHIAEKLGLELAEKTIPARAGKLKHRLKKEKILIVLDDIWKEVNLEDVGIIPSYDKDDDDDDERGTCKIVLASRDEDLLLQDMGAQECFPVQHLHEEEARQLFKKTAGDSVENNLELEPIAREVVKECQGLPVAIVTIAKALKGKPMGVWKNALEELRSCAPTNIRGVEEKVYACLELSYNHLRSDALKSLFLLCGSLGYGDISMEYLLRHAMGLDVFDHTKSLEEARNKLVALVSTLKASSLLLDGEEDHTKEDEAGASRLLFIDGHGDNKSTCSARMHDVVRDVARNIASKHPNLFAVFGEDGSYRLDTMVNESKFISLYCDNDVHKLPQRLVSPKFQFLLLRNNTSRASFNIIPDTFFDGMNQLKVLELSKMAFTTLPSTIQSLANLRTLCLDECKLGDIAVIGELKKLRVLSMVGSDIERLPQEMAQLTNLRLLDLNDCHELTVIPRNIFSSLSSLECLFMARSFSHWAVEGVDDGENNGCCLSELNHLRHLMALAVRIEDVKSVPKEDKFFENLTSYAVSIGQFKLFLERQYKTSKKLTLYDVSGSFLLGNGMTKLLEKTEDLTLREVKQKFCGPISVKCFDNVKTLDVMDCGGLKILFLLSMAGGLPQLEKMRVSSCSAMQQILAYERESEIKEDDKTNLQRFPKLRSLKLTCLQELMTFSSFVLELDTTSHNSQGNIGIPMPFFSHKVLFPNLEKLKLNDLPRLKEIWHHELPLDSFSNLKILRVKDCPCILNLIPNHLMQSFKNLKEIVVENCNVLEYVLDLQGYDNTNDEILPKLETLKLQEIFGLKGIVCNYEKNGSIRSCFSPFMPVSFHNLKCLSINYRKKHKYRTNGIPNEDEVLFGEKVSFPNLEELKLSDLPMLKMLWHPELSLEFFNKLRILEVCACPCLLHLLPSHLIYSFQNLKKVVVRDCKVLEYVFAHQGPNGDLRILPKIEILKLEELPKLGHIFCNKDENDNTSLLVSPSKLKDFHHLKELRIINCGIPLDEKVSFSRNLEVLVVESFSKLKEMDFGINPKLKILRLKKLPQLWSTICNEDENTSKRCLFSSATFKNFYNLEQLRITDCGMEHRTRDANSAVLSNEKVPFIESRASILNKIMDGLRDHNINQLLLLCDILGYAHHISLDRLLQFCMGLDLFDNMESLEQVRNKILALVESLKSLGLLLDITDEYRQGIYAETESSFLFRDGDNKFVRMRDVFSDVAKEISSKNPHPFVVLKDDVGLEEWLKNDESKRCALISLHFKEALPEGLVFPELLIFLLGDCCNNPSLNISIPNTFFLGTKKLRVLDLSGMDCTTLPSSIDSLANLRALLLEGCSDLVDIAGIGKLKKLEVLNLARSAIQQLPSEMVDLTNLRLLNLNYCRKIEVIPRNIFSSWSQLECLCMIASFTKWAAKDDHQSINACLSELNHLSCLTTLSIQIPPSKLLPKVEIQFENLTRYAILIGNNLSAGSRTNRVLKVNNVNRSLHLGDNGIAKLLERSEELRIERLRGTNYVFRPSNGESFLELKHLQVINSHEIEYIIDSMVPRAAKNMEEVWHDPIPTGSFGNLKTLDVVYCHKLRHLLLLSTARVLSQLENMSIQHCDAIQQIIAYERESEDKYGRGDTLELFPNLRTLKLQGLPQLINFISELETSSTCLSTNTRLVDSSFVHKVSLFKLEELDLRGLPKLKNIWYPRPPFESFCNLRILEVHRCPYLFDRENNTRL